MTEKTKRSEPDDGFHLTEIENVAEYMRRLREEGPLFNVRVVDADGNEIPKDQLGKIERDSQ